jgi:hypothetical protein
MASPEIWICSFVGTVPSSVSSPLFARMAMSDELRYFAWLNTWRAVFALTVDFAPYH